MDSFDWVQLQKEIERDEGRRNRPYECTEGFTTIGVGWNLDARGLPDHVIDELLDIAMTEALDDCRQIFVNWDDIDGVRQRVLVNMSFNLGRARLSGFKKMIRAVFKQNWDEAANQMLDSKWARQVGKRANRLSGMMRNGEC